MENKIIKYAISSEATRVYTRIASKTRPSVGSSKEKSRLTATKGKIEKNQEVVFKRFHRRQLEIAFQCFEENRKKQNDCFHATLSEAKKKVVSQCFEENRKKPGVVFNG